MSEGKRGIPGSTIKIIAVVTMFIDHFAAVVLDRYMVQLQNILKLQENSTIAMKFQVVHIIAWGMRLIGRMAFPLFCFCLVEGFCHTRSVKKYATTLFVFAITTDWIFDLAISDKIFDPSSQNVFFTLFLGVLSMQFMKWMEENKRVLQRKAVVACLVAPFGGVLYLMCYKNYVFEGWKTVFSVENLYAALVVGVVFGMLTFISIRQDDNYSRQRTRVMAQLGCLVPGMLAAWIMGTDYGAWGVLTIGVMYLLRTNKMRGITAGCLTLSVMQIVEATSFFTLIPISKYNGQRGAKLKYFFYIFYPAHLLALYLLTLVLF